MAGGHALIPKNASAWPTCPDPVRILPGFPKIKDRWSLLNAVAPAGTIASAIRHNLCSAVFVKSEYSRCHRVIRRTIEPEVAETGFCRAHVPTKNQIPKTVASVRLNGIEPSLELLLWSRKKRNLVALKAN